jgi:hypothetical protein
MVSILWTVLKERLIIGCQLVCAVELVLYCELVLICVYKLVPNDIQINLNRTY